MATSQEHAERIQDQALAEVAAEISRLGAEFPPALIPVVAANVAMAKSLDGVLRLSMPMMRPTAQRLLERCEASAAQVEVDEW